MFEVTIIIPAYNEGRRLPRTLNALAVSILNQTMAPLVVKEVLVVDDGSLDATQTVAHEAGVSLPAFRVIAVKPNRGKGHAVRSGLLAARSDWALVADADLSTPWSEAPHLIHATQTQSAQIAIGSRDIEGSNVILHQSWIREQMGKVFNILVRSMTRLPFRDTQCGFKLFKMDSVRPWLTDLRVDGFAWDVEVLLFARSHHLRTVEVPVMWEHQNESRVHILRDSIKMLVSLIQIRLRIWIRSL